MKKLISVMLLLCMMTACAVSCTKKEQEGNESDIDTVETIDSSGEETDEYVPTPIMSDFGGYEFRVLTRGSGSFMSDDITGEITASTLSKATYTRNAQLKQKYNFEIVEFKEGNWVAKAQMVAQTNEDAYDMWSFKLNDVPALAQVGYLYDLNKLDGLNLDAPYYDQGTRKQGSIGNYLFYVTGDMLYQDDLGAMHLVFNHDTWTETKLDDKYGKSLYELVEAKEWTFEKMKVLCAAVTYDKDGDGVATENDAWGATFSNADILGFNIGLGNDLLMKDSDDVFVVNQTEKQIGSLQSILDFFNSSSCMHAESDKSVFTSGNALFVSTSLVSIGKGEFSNSLDNYGIVPHPMYDEYQENYHSFISTYGSNHISIPITVKDTAKIANIIELISYESLSTLTPALAKYVLENRNADHAEDWEMLKIITENKKYELSYLWRVGSLYDTIKDLNAQGGVGVASLIETCKPKVESEIRKIVQDLDQLRI